MEIDQEFNEWFDKEEKGVYNCTLIGNNLSVEDGERNRLIIKVGKIDIDVILTNREAWLINNVLTASSLLNLENEKGRL